MKKWFTFAPENFGSTQAFFWRDSGLLCRNLQAMGYESRVILPKPAPSADTPEVLRATRDELESPAWWKALNLDGVIMVAWARHRDTPMVRAIAASGTRLVIHVDGSGTGYPVFDQLEHLKTLWRAERGTGQPWIVRATSFLKGSLSGAIRLLLRCSYLKYRHLRYATVVSCQTPTSVARLSKLCRIFGGSHHGVNIVLMGYPIPSVCCWNPSIPKQKRIIAIGRWNDLRQKRANVLMAVSARIATLHDDLEIDIFGTKTDALEAWHSSLTPDLQSRIHVHGNQPGELVSAAVQKAQISFFPSSAEGGPQALFEGLACGVTTVALDTPELPGSRWAYASQHGDVAEVDTVEAYVAALERELRKWEIGAYSAQAISDCWVPKTRASLVVERMIAAAVEAKP